MTCDFCKTTNIKNDYNVKSSLIGAEIYTCNKCGLVQSIYKNIENKHSYQSISCDADWGNIRHGKSIRLPNAIEIINKFVDKNKINKVLDIGSSRGDFIRWAINEFNLKDIDAIECDKNVVNSYTNLKNVNLIIDRIENIELQNNHYDLIYSSHTLEHICSPSNFFDKIKNSLKVNGHAYIEVPSIQVINDIKNIEEFFIDKHTYHFSTKNIIDYVNKQKLSIVSLCDDGYNISILIQKIKEIDIKLYESTLIENRKELKLITEKIESYTKNKRIALYGAGKTLDALVKYGDLNLNNVEFIIDDYMYKYMNVIYKKSVYPKEILKEKKVDLIILLTRSSSFKIESFLNENNVQNINYKNFINIQKEI
jgi:2-polyprenyl-3-methyl-5-hydroxy-6-metoxy-1,4-benzoquinol methylase